MPASSVTVTVKYKLSTVKYKVTVNNTAIGGTATASESGGWIVLEAFPNAGYKLDYYKVEYNGIETTAGEDGIAMPNADVTITPVFRKRVGTLSLSNYDGWGVVSVTCDGKAVNDGDSLTAGSTVNVSVTDVKAGYQAVITANGETISGSSVTVPNDGHLTIAVSYAAKQNTLTITDNWKGCFKLKVGGTETLITSDVKSISVATGAEVEIIAAGTETLTGYILDGVTKEGETKFTMPGSNATLQVLMVDNTKQIVLDSANTFSSSDIVIESNG